MFRHVALWKFADDENPGLNRQNAIKIKALMEELVYEVHGLVRLDVHIESVRTLAANADIFMESEFESRDAFRKYLDHPRRRAVEELIEACTEERLCMEFEIEDYDPTDILGETVQ